MVWRVVSGFSKILISMPLMVLVAGCAAISPKSRMGETGAPGAWVASREAKAGIDRNWVSRVGGSELKGLVDRAIAHNLDMKAAAARVERAASEAEIAGSGRLPILSLDGDGRRSQQAFIGFPGGGGGGGVFSNRFSQFGVNLNAAWEVDIWGRAKAGQEAAIASAEAQKYEYDAARVSLAGQVAKAWLALGEANEQVALAEKAVVATKVLADAVRERFERAIEDGGGTGSQVRLTRSEYENRKAALAERKQERERVIRQMELLLGSYPSGGLSANVTLPPFPGATPAGLPSELLQRRPDILAAERELASSGKKVKQAKLARFPSLNLTASGGTATESIRDVLQSDFGVWSLGGSLSQQILEGGLLGATIDKEKAVECEKVAMLQKTVLEAFGEVEQALVAEIFLCEREKAAKQAAELAKEAAKRSGEEYSAGTGNVLTVIEATQQEIDSASRHAAIRRMRLENRVDLHLALGGDFKAAN